MYLTRNQAYRKVTGVRIPPSPPPASPRSKPPVAVAFCYLLSVEKSASLAQLFWKLCTSMTDSIGSESALRSIYPPAKARSVAKQIDHLDVHCKRFIALSPFVVLATANAAGEPDSSPRGGVSGFVHVLDEHTLLIPDARGNNRLDSLSNLTESGKIGLLFMIPGIDETLRVNGRVQLATDAQSLAPFADDARVRLAIVVTVVDAYLHCAKALMRSKLWHPETWVERQTLPTMGEMLKDQTGSASPPESRTEMTARYAADL